MKINKNAVSLAQIGGHARQGDTLLRKINKPNLANKVVTRSPTLAYGEKTGHHHTFSDGGAVGFADDKKSLAEFIEVTEKTAPLHHQEHGTIHFDKGVYESLKQVEDTGSEIAPVVD